VDTRVRVGSPLCHECQKKIQACFFYHEAT
jgi:hypothetical protein